LSTNVTFGYVAVVGFVWRILPNAIELDAPLGILFRYSVLSTRKRNRFMRMWLDVDCL